MSKKSKGVNPDLEEAVSTLLKQVMADDMASLTDKCKVIDRAVNIEKLKQKISDDEWGSGFIAVDDDEG
jgi:5-bromo-4-chloroindolyl phosphate hydrolysis protein